MCTPNNPNTVPCETTKEMAPGPCCLACWCFCWNIPFLVARNSGGVFGLFQRSPVEIAERYMEARNAYDAGTRRDQAMADDVEMHDIPIISDLGELSAGFEALRRYEFQFTPYECVETVAGPPATVVCTYMMDTNLSRDCRLSTCPGRLQFHRF